jgi:hypothetical protein
LVCVIVVLILVCVVVVLISVCVVVFFSVEGKSPGWGQVLRLLSLFDTLVSQRACKIATLHLLSGSAPGDEPLADIFPLLLSLLVPAGDHALPQQHCAELVGTVLQSLCDQVTHEAPGIV